jgi:uncharacterized membrane protein YfhO
MKQKKKTTNIQKSVVKKEKSIPDFSGKFLNSYLPFVTFGLFGILVIIVFHDFIFGNLFYLFKDIGSDTLNISYPNFVNVSKYLHTDGFPLWSFADGMGQNCMAYSLSDPFCWIAYLSGVNNIASSVIWIELIKLFITAITFYLFLRLLNLSSFSIIIGTLLYCFSGFMMVGGSWYMFSSEACYLAIFLLAFEMLYSKNSWYLFPLSVALIAMLQPFDLYFYGLFILIYFLFRHFDSEGANRKKFINVSLKMIGFGLLGILISSFLFISNLQLILDSPRISGNSSYFSKLISHTLFFTENKIHYTTAILRFFSNDLLGNGMYFKGWQNYLEAPMFYIGLLPLLLIPQIFSMSDKRNKIVYAIFLLIFIIPVLFPFFRYSFWLFTGDYYRGFSFFAALSFLFLSLKVLNKIDGIKNINIIILISTLAILLIFLYYPYQDSEQIVNDSLRNKIRIFLILYAILLFFFRYKAYKPILRIMLLLIVCIEIAYINYHTVNDRTAMSASEMKQKEGYNDYCVDAVKYIYAHDKQLFRVNKDFTSNPAIHASLNNAKVQGYYGTTAYNNFNQKYYIRFLEETEIIKKGEESQTRWAPGLTSRPLLLNLASNKYQLSKQPKSFFLQLGYDSIAKFDDVRVLENRHYLPLGFTYDKYIPLSSFNKLSQLKKDIILQKAFVSEEPLNNEIKKLNAIDLKDTSLNYTYIDYFNDVKLLKQDTLKITLFKQNHITGNISLKTPKMLFFSIPYDKGWNAIIDNKKIKPMLCNIGFLGLFLEPGKHVIELNFKPPLFYESMILSIAGILIYLIIIIVYRIVKNRKTTV